MGFGTVFSTLTFLMIFSGMVMLTVQAQRSFEQASQEIRDQTARAELSTQQAIEILATTYDVNTETSWDDTYAHEFEQGNFTNTTLSGDLIELLPLNTSGTYTSPIHDTGVESNFTTIGFDAVIPGAASLEFQFRAENSTAALELLPFTGPDGTSSTYYSINGQALNTTLNQNQFIQFQATFVLGAGSPQLQATAVGIVRTGGTTIIELDNTGSRKLTFEDTDLYVDGIRLERDSSNREIFPQLLIDEQLWNPGELVNISLFYTSGTAFSLSISNEYAKDATVVIP